MRGNRCRGRRCRGFEERMPGVGVSRCPRFRSAQGAQWSKYTSRSFSVQNCFHALRPLVCHRRRNAHPTTCVRLRKILQTPRISPSRKRVEIFRMRRNRFAFRVGQGEGSPFPRGPSSGSAEALSKLSTCPSPALAPPVTMSELRTLPKMPQEECLPATCVSCHAAVDHPAAPSRALEAF